MNTSEKINKFIDENGGNVRDALNVALARLELSENDKQFWKEKAKKLDKSIPFP